MNSVKVRPSLRENVGPRSVVPLPSLLLPEQDPNVEEDEDTTGDDHWDSVQSVLKLLNFYDTA